MLTTPTPCASSTPRNPLPNRFERPYPLYWLQHRYGLSEPHARAIAQLLGLGGAS